MGSAPTCVDLFAGCGGLSLGLKRAGFEVKLAVEKSPMAAETYYHNFIKPIRYPGEWRDYLDLPVKAQARSGLVVRTLEEVLTSKETLDRLRDEGVDLVAGGPPCQGFSSAGRRDPSDARNMLPWQFLDFVEAVEPKAVIIENVSGMQHDFRKHGKASPFRDLRVALEQTGPGYTVQPMALNAMHFGVPQNRPRVFLLGIRADLAAGEGVKVAEEAWDSSIEGTASERFRERPRLAPARTHFDGGARKHLTVGDAISDLDHEGYRPATTPSAYAREMRSHETHVKHGEDARGVTGRPRNHEPRSHSEHVQKRFQFLQFARDAKVRRQVLSFPVDPRLDDADRRSMIHEAIAGVDYPVVHADGTVLAGNKSALVRRVNQLASMKHSQRALSLDKPAPTVLSLPDDHVHPTEPRTLTVREMARFQSFPDAFEFRGQVTTGGPRRRTQVPQYTQVGNAVPPRLAEAIGRNLLEVLGLARVDGKAKEARAAVA